MKDKLFDLTDLMELLGFEDERTIIKWCKKNKIPVLKLGKRKYTVSNILELFITAELKTFMTSNYRSHEDILSAISNDNKEHLAELINAPLSDESRNNFKTRTKTKNSFDEKFDRYIKTKAA